MQIYTAALSAFPVAILLLLVLLATFLVRCVRKRSVFSGILAGVCALALAGWVLLLMIFPPLSGTS